MRSKYPVILILLVLLLTVTLLAGGESSSKKDPFSQKKFLPAISLIIDFSYVRRNIEQEIFESLSVPGFFEGDAHAQNDGHSHGSPNNEEGFNFNYGELVLAAAVDPYLDLFASFHLSEDSFEIEEAYVTTRRLPLGLRLKLGKFLSGFGRLNSQHAHLWDFSDIPLVYRAFFGQEGMADKGIQLNWVAPSDFYLAFGIETLQGSSLTSFGTKGFHLIDADTEEELEIEDSVLPSLWTFFGKTSMETGDLVLLTGASFASGSARSNHFEDEREAHGFSGNTKIFGIDVTAKYIIDSYRYLALQVEYISRTQKGTRYDIHGDGEGHEGEEAHEAFEVEDNPFEKRQAGFYGQLVYRFHRLWRIGGRWDRLLKNDVQQDGNSRGLPENLNRYSFMMDHSPTEFSRVRLQYNINRYTTLENEPKHYQSIVLQFNLAIGAHGAHPF